MPKPIYQRTKKKSKSTKELKKIMRQVEAEEDFLDPPQDDNVLDMVFNEYVQKDE
jgi:hypothetical protein